MWIENTNRYKLTDEQIVNIVEEYQQEQSCSIEKACIAVGIEIEEYCKALRRLIEEAEKQEEQKLLTKKKRIQHDKWKECLEEALRLLDNEEELEEKELDLR